MNEDGVLPELKEIVGALIFGADRPLSINEIHRCLREVGEKDDGVSQAFGDVHKKELVAAVASLEADAERAKLGFRIGQVAGGYRLHSDPKCAVWLKHLLKMEKPARLSRPALETLAIVAYRQPVTRAQIESVRGVAVDHLVKILMEMQLIRIAGRSELPGRPFLYGTTQLFLEHFGLNTLADLSNLDPMLALKKEQLAASYAGAPGPVPAELVVEPDEDVDQTEIPEPVVQVAQDLETEFEDLEPMAEVENVGDEEPESGETR